MMCVGEAFEGLREGERGKEGAQTGRGDDDDVVVAGRVAGRPSEPAMAHNLIKKTRTGAYELLIT